MLLTAATVGEAVIDGRQPNGEAASLVEDMMTMLGPLDGPTPPTDWANQQEQEHYRSQLRQAFVPLLEAAAGGAEATTSILSRLSAFASKTWEERASSQTFSNADCERCSVSAIGSETDMPRADQLGLESFDTSSWPQLAAVLNNRRPEHESQARYRHYFDHHFTRDLQAAEKAAYNSRMASVCPDRPVDVLSDFSDRVGEKIRTGGESSTEDIELLTELDRITEEAHLMGLVVDPSGGRECGEAVSRAIWNAIQHPDGDKGSVLDRMSESVGSDYPETRLQSPWERR